MRSGLRWELAHETELIRECSIHPQTSVSFFQSGFSLHGEEKIFQAGSPTEPFMMRDSDFAILARDQADRLAPPEAE
jgi:hypothetical protein